MKKRIWSLLLALSLAVSMFSACGDKGENASTSDVSVSTSEEHVCTPVDGAWKHNSSVHWQLCACGEKVNVEKHKGGDSSCTQKPSCEVCGKEYGKVTGHTYGELTELESGVQGYACECGETQPLLTVEKEDGTKERGLVDFAVEVEEGKDPVILHLSDPQLTSKYDAETRCYRYIRETVQATEPDLIIITGDLVYGRFDKDGAIFKDFINFMETLKTPWAPVFGNHDNECWLGVDWQCEQLEAAEYCLFDQGDVIGNGNYSVAIMQGSDILRVFYMMDSNGCSQPRIYGDGTSYTTNTEVTPGKNKVKKDAGFDISQTAWYTASIEAISEVSAATKFSIAYHIQQAYFEKAYEQYDEYTGILKQGSSSELLHPLDFDTMENTKEGDIGYLGRAMKGPWDSTFSVFTSMKKLGVDSLFVGHEHCNSASVVYNGIRFQYGQKSSTYDRYNSINASGEIYGGYSNAGTELIGGTAFSLSQEDGTIINPYIYLYGDPLGRNPKKQ